MFKFYADKNKLTVQQKEPVTSGSVNVYRVQFVFSPEWDGLTRTAVFRGGEETWSVLLDETDECIIPWEALAQPVAPLTRLQVGVYGIQGNEVVLPTVWADCGAILEGTVPGESAQPPTPDVYQQFLVQIEAVRDDVLGSRTGAIQAAQDAGTAAKAAEQSSQQAQEAQEASEAAAAAAGAARTAAGSAADQAADSAETVSAAVSRALASAGAAEQSAAAAQSQAERAAVLTAKMPVIRDGAWWTYDPEREEYVSTGQAAQGSKGDAGETGPTGSTGPQGDRGATGATPELEIGDVTTLSPGEPAAASITGTPEHPVLHLSIPKGDPGKETAIDPTLSHSGEAADSGAVGTALARKADGIFLTCGPDAVVTTDVAAEGSSLQAVSGIKPVQVDGSMSGWDSIMLNRCGKNLISQEKMADINNWEKFNYTYRLFKLPCKTGMTYTISLSKKVGLEDVESITEQEHYCTVRKVLPNGSSETAYILNSAVVKTKYERWVPSYTFTAEDGYSYAIGVGPVNSFQFYDYQLEQIRTMQLEPGGEATAFEPFIGEVYSVQLPETVYGGTFDWTKGKLTVTHEMANASIAALPEPKIIQLIPQEIPAVEGENVLSSDCGETTVTVQADLKKYIDKRICEIAKPDAL